MDLTTRCPRCGTVFQASLSDLQLRKGYIRCVQCAHIFDGYAEVVQDASQRAAAESPSSVAPVDEPDLSDVVGPGVSGRNPQPEVPAEGASFPQVIRAGRPTFRGSAPVPEPEFRVGVAPWPDDGPVSEPSWNEPHLGADATREADQADADEPLVAWHAGPPVARDAHAIVVEAHPTYRSAGGSAAPLLRDDTVPGLWTATLRFLGWILLVLLAVLLLGQLVYVYRGQVARMAPAVRPWLEQACVPLHCRVPYARDISQITITGSALKVADTVPASGAAASPDAKEHFVLQLTLRNQLGQPQEWPTLVLDLKDSSGALLVRRNLSPADYLGPTLSGQPFAAHSDALLRVPLTLSGVRINGYQLDLFFP